MATPRHQLIDQENALTYHVVSRCVRRSWLCGTDPDTGRNYNHRKRWLEERLLRLCESFAVELFGFAIMSNHFHLIVRYDPLAATTWSDEEVVERWLRCCTVRGRDQQEIELKKLIKRNQLLQNPERIRELRKTLGSLSMFMKYLKQPIALRSNQEDECHGHFFEGRFYSGALLDDASVIAAMAYVDLNPVRARQVKRAIEADHTSLNIRLSELAASQSRLDEYLKPVASGLREPHGEQSVIPVTLSEYLELLERFSLSAQEADDKAAAWYRRLTLFKRRQRAFGLKENLQQWTRNRGWSRVGVAT